MRVKVNEIQAGCILAKEITGRTGRAIIRNKTVITANHLEILKAFLIKEASVEKTMIDGRLFDPKERIENEDEDNKEESSFTQHYLKAVQNYKLLFKNWQAGSNLDVAKVREIFLPLLERMLNTKFEIFYLHHYSTKEDYIYHHAIATGLICGYIAKALRYDDGEIMQIALAGCLSDCGMAKIPASIIDKKSSLSSSEFEEIKKHPAYGLKMVQHNTFLRDGVKFAIAQHHERLDGSGYPIRNKEQKLHPFSKIVAVADVFHAMTSERVYRKKESPFKVLEMIKQDYFGKFDLAVLQTLLDGISTYLSGNQVKLSNGTIARVLFIEQKSPTRPLVQLADSAEIVNLEQKREWYIEEVLK
ncbi:HD-GYP domain-containing protein (c-di-GMP phosphodiesterase class II) [Peribacillus deserti]|uniref:HD-GYP domain-containing protein (C-di-GMP phosphodiesterase class II) n=1 Tax=Peribacillus deserti TaxID=673318 RepID=A0ABS2QLD7_9BACI|nr:HD-GYP domain-containing protein [Peribacillus deserti]MBM7693584.1 HD-GYP domain-containing protein (c-di-GMP phosphodiesterase class II) [Peribacillus deserti]